MMRSDEIVLYGIGGLGADERVFKYLDLVSEIKHIKWIKPRKNEPLAEYAERIVVQIDESEKFGLIGVSFGGMLAKELNKIVKPVFTILISSVSKSTELPFLKTFVSKLNILPLLPNSFLKPPFFILNFLFGADDSNLLKEIIKDTDPDFLRWAIGEILKWENAEEFENIHQIHGSKDRLIPMKNKSSLVIKNGGHFMIVDNASQISKLINAISSQYQ